ncbi:triphosphoribosyl-dephospho-CoA synthase CitG [Vibrio sp. WXL103]|uniref:triphosphoribosyl-dephospho-CoA synthase CitG n=1 Tax=Vibrio sp. WXL103 TaxID=3450710 RepID=UPI003EC907C7
MIASNSIRWLLDDCSLYQSLPNGQMRLNITELVGNLAYHAMMLEAHLTPKPGLVDCASPGAHKDMDINTFVKSSNALRPFMKTFVRAGIEVSNFPQKDLLPHLRKVGIEAEQAMFTATSGVNTHKGMIFTLGLICGAVGWLSGNHQAFNSENIRKVISECCQDLVTDDLKANISTPKTAGERLFQRYGLTGIRGEAALGYPTIFEYGLPIYEHCITRSFSEEQAMSKTLLSIMANNSDTNLVSRGGIAGLRFVQAESKRLLGRVKFDGLYVRKYIVDFDKALVERNLSPGGSADLLAATWLLAQLNLCHQSNFSKQGNDTQQPNVH